MKKLLSLVLALLMVFSCCAFAESGGNQAEMTEEEKAAQAAAEAAAAAEIAFMETDCAFAVIEANGKQVRLTYDPNVTTILEVDGLKFKDLNKNGQLDVYEDWRQITALRVEDILSQMTIEEEVGLLWCINTALEEARYMTEEFNLTCQLFNLNGTPITITNSLNHLQQKAESLRLGVPVVITSDREYNSFGGYVDKSHEGFGTASDPELAAKLAAFYGQAMSAIGVHVTFEPYANEIGAQYGENPEIIAPIIAAEVAALEANGLTSCVKHWIGRGGDSNFGNARSVAQNFDNWMVGWKAGLNAGAGWVMTNCGGTGITNTVDVKYDAITMGYLRNELGFDGIIVTDWWPLGMGAQVSGVNPDGIEIGEQSIAWLYAECMRNGVNIFGTPSIAHGTEVQNLMQHYPDIVLAAIDKEIPKTLLDHNARQILTYKFEKGLFENPYRDVAAAVELCASIGWAANPVAPTTNEEVRDARNPYEVALTEELMAKSTVLVKNDNDLLPLEKGIKIYIESSSSDVAASLKKYVGEYATVVETVEECDVILADYTSINDACELIMDDADYYGKPIILGLNSTSRSAINLTALNGSDALLYITYNHKADHGSTVPGLTTTISPWVYADMLFGVREPGGIIVKEITRNATDDKVQWKDLAGDQGADPYVRLMVQATMAANVEGDHAAPNNWGDPLVQAHYGMKYGVQPEFVYSCLILPTEVVEVEGTDSSGRATVTATAMQQAKAGEPCTVYCLINNNGGDGITTVQVKANGEVVAEKVMTVCGGSWRVFQCDITLEAGEYTIDIGGQTGTLTIQ